MFYAIMSARGGMLFCEKPHHIGCLKDITTKVNRFTNRPGQNCIQQHGVVVHQFHPILVTALLPKEGRDLLLFLG